ncbi:DUF4249 domain-containing protein [Owenweeksia hongkongensis]|uniref:DUF4249 domain-containing protein n=1 Tax=Owenweeksia hongkongensis TaxID=253245 RepID=UPI003A8D75B0
MIQIKYFLFPLISLVLFSSCETTIEYDLPQEPNKITIDSKLVEGDTPVVHVFTSTYTLSRDNPGKPKNAEVSLIENGIEVSKLTVQSNLYGETYYSSDYQILPNELYRVQVSLPEYETAFGEGLTKEAVPVSSTIFDTSSNDLEFTFQDPPTSGDYYLITVKSLTDSYPISYSTNDVVINFFDEYTFDDPFSSGGEKIGQNGYMTDELFNGKTKTVRMTVRDIDIPHNQTPRLIELWHISEDLYNHERTKAVAWQSENPFSEPAQIYSNITNGYGIVGTAAVDRKQFFP